MVFPAVIIPTRQGVTFTHEAQGLVGIKVKFTNREIIFAVEGGKGLVVVDIDAPYRIDDIEEGGEVEADIIVDWRVVETGQGMHGSLHAIDPCVSQLVLLICPAIRDWHIGVTRRSGQKNLVSLRVDSGDNVHV